jgi:hypothetical protein
MSELATEDSSTMLVQTLDWHLCNRSFMEAMYRSGVVYKITYIPWKMETLALTKYWLQGAKARLAVVVQQRACSRE